MKCPYNPWFANASLNAAESVPHVNWSCKILVFCMTLGMLIPNAALGNCCCNGRSSCCDKASGKSVRHGETLPSCCGRSASKPSCCAHVAAVKSESDQPTSTPCHCRTLHRQSAVVMAKTASAETVQCKIAPAARGNSPKLCEQQTRSLPAGTVRRSPPARSVTSVWRI